MRKIFYSLLVCALTSCLFFWVGQWGLSQEHPAHIATLTISQTVPEESSSPPTEEDSAEAESDRQAEEGIDAENTQSGEGEPAPVILGAKELFTLEVGLGPLSPEERAETASENIAEFADDRSLGLDSLDISEIEGIQLLV